MRTPRFGGWLAAVVSGAALCGATAIAYPAVAQPTPQTMSSQAETYYLVSLNAAPLAEAAEAVVTQSLKARVLIDDGLSAEVSLEVADRLSRDQLEEKFAVALADHHLALVRVGDDFRIMDLSAALSVRPALDIVAPPLPQMKPGAAAAIARDASPSSTPTMRSQGRRSLSAAGMGFVLIVLASAFASTWVWVARRRRKRAAMVQIANHSIERRNAVLDKLLSAQPVDLPVLAQACDRAVRDARPLEQVLCDLGAATEESLAQAYSDVSGLARWRPRDQPAIDPPASPDRLKNFVETNDLKILEIDEWAVTVASADPFDDLTFATLSRLAGRMVTLRVAQRSEVRWNGQASKSAAFERPLVVPWAKPVSDGSALLQGILSRRLAAQARSD